MNNECKSAAGLTKIFREKGVASKEFFEYSKPFFTYLIKRYNYGVYDEEIHSTCFCRLIGACETGLYRKDGTYIPPYYDESRVNIATFVHSLVRNNIVSGNYKLRRFVDCFESLENTTVDTPTSDCSWEELLDYSDDMRRSILKDSYIYYSSEDKLKDFIDSRRNNKNPAKKTLLWNLSKQNFLSAETL